MATSGGQTGRLAPQSVLTQRYVIVQLAGRGGMSAIYQALDRQRGGMRVAIKEMSLENLDEMELQDALARFQQEAHLLETLNHPNLTRIYDAFSENGRSFLVMDYIDGKTLLQLLQAANKPLPVQQVMHYAEQLCDVLSYLHQHNPPIIFRDLKPTNVMITPDGHIYLIDFGIARFFKEGQPQDTTVLGSPGYAPPEQHGSGQTNPRSDIYALGATLHCCLSNRDPYHATDRFAFAPVRQFNPLVPEALDQLILRMVALDENQRPASAGEVKQALVSIRQQLQNQRVSSPIPPVAVSTPASAAPTQYMQPPQAQAYQPTMPVAPPGGTTGPQERLILRAVPQPAAPPISSSSPAYPAPPYPVLPPARQSGQQSARSAPRVWTPGFVILFLLLLALTIGSSYLAFNLVHPYGPANNAGLDHLTEAGLLVLALLISLINLFTARKALTVLLTLGSAIGLLATGAALLVQTLRDIQNDGQIFAGVPIDTLLTAGLLAASVLLLFWLFHRPMAGINRFWLFLFFAAAGASAYAQSLYTDTQVLKHILLLVMLIILIEGLLLAGQTARKAG
jgi:serine/threonine protein kinase